MKQKKLTQKEIDAIDNYGTPLKPQPELPSDAMDKKKKGGMSKYKAQPMPYIEGAMEEPKMKRMPYIEDAMEEFKMKPMPYYEDDDMGLEGAAQGAIGEAVGRKKGGMTKGQKKVGKVMSEFKAGKLKSSSGKKVTNPKQAIAIGLSEAGMSKKKMQNGGMVRGQGAAIRGTKFKGIF
jgi:hypothetical protein